MYQPEYFSLTLHTQSNYGYGGYEGWYIGRGEVGGKNGPTDNLSFYTWPRAVQFCVLHGPWLELRC